MYSTLSTCPFIHGFGQKLFLQLQYKQKLFSQSDPFESGKREIEKEMYVPFINCLQFFFS